MIELTTLVVAVKDQVSCDLAGEAAILNLKNGVYYGLDPVGAYIWRLLQKPISVESVLDALLREYEVHRQRCEEDVLSLLRDMALHGLIEIAVEAAA